jgi:hypothetical protein
MAIVRVEGLVKFKKANDLIGNRIRDLPACSILPQPAMLPLLYNVHLQEFVIKIDNFMLSRYNMVRTELIKHSWVDYLTMVNRSIGIRESAMTATPQQNFSQQCFHPNVTARLGILAHNYITRFTQPSFATTKVSMELEGSLLC